MEEGERCLSLVSWALPPVFPVVTNPEVAVAVIAIFVVMCLTSDQSRVGWGECVT